MLNLKVADFGGGCLTHPHAPDEWNPDFYRLHQIHTLGWDSPEAYHTNPLDGSRLDFSAAMLAGSSERVKLLYPTNIWQIGRTVLALSEYYQQLSNFELLTHT